MEGKIGGVFRTVRNRLASFNMSPDVLGALRVRPPGAYLISAFGIASDCKPANGRESKEAAH